jgi:hypothetical protein
MPEAHPNRRQFLAALNRKHAMKGFKVHLIVYLAVMVGLVVINFLTGGHWWFQWVLIGWGLGILGHAYLVYRS